MKPASRAHWKAYRASSQIPALSLWRGLICNPARRHQGDLEDPVSFYSDTKKRDFIEFTSNVI